jgi:hypothetical protein
MCRLHSIKISTGTLGEKKANVKLLFFPFVLLSPLRSTSCQEVIYKHLMDYSRKRSASVTGAAIVATLCGLFILLCCSVVFLGFLLAKLPGTESEFPPSMRHMMLGSQVFMMGLSLWGVATGFGLLYLRKWARISILIWGGLSVFFGVCGIPIAYLMLLSRNPYAPTLPVEGMQAVRGILLVIYGAPFVIGVWWLILFNRKSVQAQFADSALPADPTVPPKPACPLPIAVLAWFYVTSILNLLFLPFFPASLPVSVFGLILLGTMARAILVLSFLAFFAAGVGLLKLKPWSYTLVLGLQLFWLASTVVSMLRPAYKAAMQSFLEQYQASFHLPASQYTANPFIQYFGWFMVFGMVFAGVILGLFVYYRPRFLEAASRAAASS